MAKKLKATEIHCLRCAKPLYFLGKREFHEGSRVGVFGDLFELAQSREEFQMYACGGCGHVEFFIRGVGEEQREVLAED
jgi:hypothetical protein